MPHSHHSHSGQFCKHASGSLEGVVAEAIKKGFEVYGLTEHVPRYRAEDLYPEEEGMSVEALRSQFDDFLTEAHRLRELHADAITLLVGLETEFISEADLDHLERTLKSSPGRIEYLVGSIHHVNGIPIDFDRTTYEKALASFSTHISPSTPNIALDAYLSSYFDSQYKLLRRFQPEIVGHIDLCRLYEPSLKLSEYPYAWQKFKRNVQYAIEYGALFEMNAAAFRKGWTSAYPADDAVGVIKELGGRFALSDDSHGPHAVGLNYDRLSNYLRRLEIDDVWFLERSEVPNPAGRYVQPRKAQDHWWEHPFWKRVVEG